MPSDKNRLYVVLYARGGKSRMPGGEDTYHWALMVGPKIESADSSGLRYHARERLGADGGSEWYFEEKSSVLSGTMMQLVRVMIAKVANNERAAEIMRSTAIRQGTPDWNCVSWVREALERLTADGKALGTNVVEWSRVRDGAMNYCQEKKDQHRFDGQGTFDMQKAATYDLIEGRETIP